MGGCALQRTDVRERPLLIGERKATDARDEVIGQGCSHGSLQAVQEYSQASPLSHRGLTQKALPELVDLSLIQIHRYEAGTAQPSLDGIRKLARALRVPADSLVFEQDERGPDEDESRQRTSRPRSKARVVGSL